MNLTTIKNVAPSVAVALAALGLVSALVVRTSDAAFTAQVSNAGNSFQSGQVTLTTDAVSALFAVPAMEPGQVATECLVLTYAGNIVDPEPVALRTIETGQLIGDTALADWLLLDVEQGPPGANCGFTAGSGTQLLGATETIADFAANRRTYATGAQAFDPDPPSGDTSRAFRFTVTLDPATPNTLQDLSLTNVEFVWEVTS